MKGKQILVLGAIFIVLVVIVMLSRLSEPGHKTRIEEDVLVGEFDTGQAAYVEFYHGGKPEVKVALVKKEGLWTVPARHGARADKERVEKLLKDIAGLKGEARTSDPALFGEFAISDKEAVHFIVKDTGGSNMAHLLIGKAGPDHRSGFVRLAGGNSVYPVDVAMLSRLGVSRQENAAVSGIEDKRWLDLTILPDFKAEEVVKLSLDSPERGLAFERTVEEQEEGQKKKGPWAIVTEGIAYKAKDAGIESVLSGLAGRRAEDVADPDNMKDYGFDKPTHTAEITADSGKTTKIAIGASFEQEGAKKYYLKIDGDPLPYIAAQYLVDRLFEDAKKLLDLKVFEIKEKDAGSVLLDGPEYHILIQRSEAGRWEVASPPLDFKADKEAAKKLAGKYLTFVPDDILNKRKKEDSGQAQYAATIRLADGKEHKMFFSEELEGSEGERLCWTDSHAEFFIVGKNAFRQLFPDISTLLDIRLAQIDRESLERITIKREREEFQFREDEGKWRLEILGYEFEAFSRKVEEILNSFTDIKPSAVIITEDLEKYGLEKPILTVEIKGYKEKTSISIGKKDDSGTNYYARDNINGLVFKMADKSAESARARMSQMATLRVFPTGNTPDFISLKATCAPATSRIDFSAKLKEKEKDGKKVAAWIDNEGREVKTELITRLISRITSIMATDVRTDTFEITPGDDKRDGECVILGFGEEEIVLDIVERDEKEKTFLCRKTAAEGLLSIRASLIEPVFREALKFQNEVASPEKEGQ